jgi:hypothetical protein
VDLLLDVLESADVRERDARLLRRREIRIIVGALLRAA